MDENLTPRQREAVLAKGKNILVSASAGSGKTHVMIERIINLIINEGIGVENILAVTYTNLAASEMKQKLVKAVIEQINKGKDVERMKQTLAEIPTADISTFHSFCLNLLRTYFYAVGLEPDFSICDEATAKEFSTQALQDVFNALYESRDQDFLKLVRFFRRGRRDENLKTIVEKIYEFARSEAYPEEFLTKCENSTTEEKYQEFIGELLKIYKDRLLGSMESFEELKMLCISLNTANANALVQNLDNLNVKVQACLSADDLSRFKKACLIKLDSLPRFNKDTPVVLDAKEQVRELKKKVGDIFNNFKKKIPDDLQIDKNRFLSTANTIKTLCRICLLYGKAFTEIKRMESVTDFSDLEHLTLRLLKTNEEVLNAVRQKYAYIFADEYQDVNGVQEEILSLISRQNLFMVGDVKQSIYSFRGCNPDIFSEKYSDFEENNTGYAIPLDRNFRSSDGVLKSVNKIFSKVITKDFGGINYEANPMLAGGLFKEGYGESTLHIINKNTDDNQPIEGLYDIVAHAKENKTLSQFSEGELIKRIIEAEVKNNTIYDIKKKCEREVTYSDIAVITRNSKGYTDDIVKYLSNSLIPVLADSKKGIIVYPEIKLLINVLKLIDYYADDAPLASVLKSAIGGLSDEDLAKIYNYTVKTCSKEARKKMTFRDSVELYKKEGENVEIKNKLFAFEEYFNQTRILAEFLSAGELLSKIMREKGLDVQFACSSFGETRLQRVERFISESSSGGKNLSVSEFLKKIENGGSEISIASVSSDSAVKVMSMHASKGLEFPIVIIPGIHKEFNSLDDKKEYLLSRKNGLVVNFYDEIEKVKYGTLAKTYFLEISRQERAKEEARIFYVALTRAQSRLHVVSTAEISDNRTINSTKNATHFKDFISKADMPVKTYEEETLSSQNTEKPPVCVNDYSEDLSNKILERVSYTYPNIKDTLLPVKDAVSSVSSRHAQKTEKIFTPSTVISEEIDKAKIGTLYHRFMELCDFNEKSANNQLIRLLSEGKLSKEERLLLDEEVLDKILNLPFIDQLKSYNLYREQQFITSFSARELYEDDSDAEVLVQGIIDLLAVKGNEGIIVDYKTSDHAVERLKADYSKQLELYAKAVEKTLDIKIKNTYILNLKTGEIIET